ncbi:M14 family metallopeptidase [Hymenobacter volaticus]|uniref:M14 family metallopeptidase n=1 Tax=Hymenobacter volaticus TaxID=2932254 RepID=A0ABY4GEH3_9BACT|nr:M14 family metallopeptidase [Hymenobacter volaticus]UOQ69258.1 M14 family metallopeptidase [Hymenobacter volaticus]
MPIRILLVVFLCAIQSLAGVTVKPFSFRNETIKAGTKRAMLLPVVAGKDSTVIPVTVFHGAKQGPVVGIIAGVHGYEYPPIIAAQQFAQSLDPAQLSGTVILVHLANVPGFLGHRTDVNPLDNKNLNRVFPGKVDGTITERMAWVLSNDIIARCNFVVDVHAGDAPEDLRPYSGYYNYFDTPELSEKGRQMAVALGFPYVVQFGNEPTLKEAAIYCSREAIKRGIPAVDIECGRLGQVEAENVALIKQALHNLLVHLRIEEGTLSRSQPYLIARRTSINSAHTGFFYPLVKAGEFIYKGRKLGFVTDLFGNHLSEVISPVDGVVLYMSATPPIGKGDELFSIGQLPLITKS